MDGIKSLSLLALLALPLLSGCPVAADAILVDAADATSLAIASTDFDVMLMGSDRTDVSVTFVVDNPADGDVDVTGTLDGDVVRVAATADDGVTGTITVSGPADLIWDIAGASAAVSAMDMTGAGAVATSSGAITGSGLSGDLDLSSSSGVVDVSVNPADGAAIDIATTSGDVTLGFPNSVGASFDAATGGMDITFSGGADFQGTNMAGAASGTLNGGGSVSVDIASGSGVIAVEGY